MRAAKAGEHKYLSHFSLEPGLVTHFALARAQVPQALGCDIPPGTASLKSMTAPKPNDNDTRFLPTWVAAGESINDIVMKNGFWHRDGR